MKKIYISGKITDNQNSKTNWGALEQFIQKVNENPGLRVDVEHRDGTVIHLQTTTKKQFDPYIGD